MERQYRIGGAQYRPNGRVSCLGVQRQIDRPFEPRHIGEINEFPTGRKAREEIGKTLAIFGETRARREGLADVLMGGVAEEPLVDEPTDHREDRLERLVQGQNCVIAVDLQARLLLKATGFY